MNNLTVTLTERQWDHIILAIENELGQWLQSGAQKEKAGMPTTGSEQGIARFLEIHKSIVEQLGIPKREKLEVEVKPITWQLSPKHGEKDDV